MSDTLCNEKKKPYTFSEDGNSCIITEHQDTGIIICGMKIITVRRFPRQDMGAAITSVKKQICV